MIIQCVIFSFMISFIAPQSFIRGNTFYSPDQSSGNIFFRDRPSTQNFNSPPITRNPVGIEISKDISARPTVEQENIRRLSNNALPNRAVTTQQIPQGQIAFLPDTLPQTLPQQVPQQGPQQVPHQVPHQVPQQGPQQVPQQVPEQVPQTLPQQVPSAEKFNQLLYSVTNLGIKLLKNINSNEQGNVVVSPYSISSVLSLLQQGASGLTQNELTELLNMTPKAMIEAYSRITADYKNRKSPSVLRTANKVYVGDSFNIKNDFKRKAEAAFDSEISKVSFKNPIKAARDINKWVASKTMLKIDKVVTPDAFDASTQMVLVNAIYFKGLWKVPFKVQATRPSEFYQSNGVIKTAQFMRMRNIIQTGVDKATKAKVAILPFEGDEYSLMVIVPPRSHGVTRFLENLSDDRLLSYFAFPVEDTDLELPKFAVKGDINLNVILSNMGVPSLFTPYAELDGLGTYAGRSPFISSAVHSAVLSIDEQGGSAAAATAFAGIALSYDMPTATFKADSPFIAVLWDSKLNLPLFIAKISDP